MEGKYLITTDKWFLAPDGKQYKGVWGDVKIIDDVFLGVKTNRNSSNWFAKVGSEKKHIIIAGCQIHYAARTDEKPNNGMVEEYSTNNDGCVEFSRPTQIYIAE